MHSIDIDNESGIPILQKHDDLAAKYSNDPGTSGTGGP